MQIRRNWDATILAGAVPERSSRNAIILRWDKFLLKSPLAVFSSSSL
jgi:hypothetical protein